MCLRVWLTGLGRHSQLPADTVHRMSTDSLIREWINNELIMTHRYDPLNKQTILIVIHDFACVITDAPLHCNRLGDVRLGTVAGETDAWRTFAWKAAA